MEIIGLLNDMDQSPLSIRKISGNSYAEICQLFSCDSNLVYEWIGLKVKECVIISNNQANGDIGVLSNKFDARMSLSLKSLVILPVNDESLSRQKSQPRFIRP